jgi:hypothetical protein
MQTTLNQTPALEVPDHQSKNLAWYIANQKDLAAKYNGSILLIVDQALVATFESMADAYGSAIKSYSPGMFTLQPCSPDSESYTTMFYTPMYSIHG